MKYTIIGNKNYIIDDKLSITRTDGKPLDLTIKNGEVAISLYGIKKKVDLKWLYVISKHKLDMPKGYEKRVFDIIYKPIDLKSHGYKDEYVILFKKPIYVADIYGTKFRLIARYPSYAISCDGTILDITNMILRTYKKTSNYKSARIKHNCEYVRIKIHRVVALTWLDESVTNDFTKYPIINHKDGDKGNNHYSNLEWVSFSENNAHAKRTVLSKQSIMIKVKDILENTITYYASVGSFSEHINSKLPCCIEERIERSGGQYVYKNRYIIKLAEDTSDFKDIVNKNDLIITLVIDNKKFTYTNYQDIMIEHFGRIIYVNPTKSKVYKKLKEKYYRRNIELYTNYIRIYMAKNIITNEIIEGPQKVIMDKTGISKPSLLLFHKRKKQTPINGYIFTLKNGIPFEDIEIVNTLRKFKVLISNNKEHYEFDSLREAARFLKKDKKTVKIASKRGHKINGYTIQVRSDIIEI